MRVIVTRADNEAVALGEKLEKAGFTPLNAPMMTIEYNEDPIDLSEYQGVITSSANGVRALSLMTEERDVPLFCIGKPSEKIAQGLGFTNTKSSIGNFNNMGIFVSRHYDAEGAPMLYLHGEHVTGNPLQELRKVGVKARAKRAYAAKGIDALPEDVKAEMQSDTPPEFATFFSIRTFKLFQHAVTQEGLTDRLKDTVAVALSPAIADFARGLRWKKVLTTDESTGDAVVKAIADYTQPGAEA